MTSDTTSNSESESEATTTTTTTTYDVRSREKYSDLIHRKNLVFVAGAMNKIMPNDNKERGSGLSHFIPLDLEDIDGQIVDIQGTDNDCFMLTSTGHVYSTFQFHDGADGGADGGDGADGGSSSERATRSHNLYVDPSMKEVRIGAIYCGGMFVHAKCSQTGQLYGVGDNTRNRLGVVSMDDAMLHTFTPLDMSVFRGLVDKFEQQQQMESSRDLSNDVIEFVSSSDKSAYYLAKNRRQLFVSGEGMPRADKYMFEPIQDALPDSVATEISNDPFLRIKQISSGSSHTLVLFNDNRILAFGSDSHCQTGGAKTGTWIEYSFPSPIRFLYSGSFHSFYLTEQKVYSSGYSGDHRLGHDLSGRIHEITCFDQLPSQEWFVEDIIGRASTMFVVRDENNVRRLFNIGSNHYGEAGIGCTGSLAEVKEVQDPLICTLINDSSLNFRHACGYYFRFLYFTRVHRSIDGFYANLQRYRQEQDFTDVVFTFQQ